MHRLQLPTRVLALLVGCVLSTSLLQAREMIPPTNLRVSIAVDETLTEPLYSATFTWEAASFPDGDVDGYRLYAKKLGDPAGGEFLLLSTSTVEKITLTQNDVDISGSAHSFRVTALSGTNESEPSNIVSTVCGRDFNDGDYEKYVNKGETRFVTTPPTKAQTGEPYRYDAGVAVEVGSPDHSDLEYSLLNAPAGMKIDAASGVVTWTPETPGSYFVTVQASLSDGIDSDQQSWRLDVAGSVADLPGVETDWSVRLYPNPTTSTMTIAVQQRVGATDVTFVDMEGRILYTHMVEPGDWSQTFDLSGFSAGVYVLQVRGREGVRSIPITVVK